jgi:hypothetical protein
MIPFHRAAEKGALAYPISCNLALACGDEMQFNEVDKILRRHGGLSWASATTVKPR